MGLFAKSKPLPHPKDEENASHGTSPAGSFRNVETTQTPDDIPDGGVVAWTQVAMGHLVIFNCWGYITS